MEILRSITTTDIIRRYIWQQPVSILILKTKPKQPSRSTNQYSGGEFEGGGISRFGDVPPVEDAPVLSEYDKQLVMHVSLPILGGVRLMGTYAPESMGFKLTIGNNVYISLHPDTRGETERLFTALATGGRIEMPLQEMFWGDYFGSCVDRFGVQWMFNCESKS